MVSFSHPAYESTNTDVPMTCVKDSSSLIHAPTFAINKILQVISLLPCSPQMDYHLNLIFLYSSYSYNIEYTILSIMVRNSWVIPLGRISHCVNRYASYMYMHPRRSIIMTNSHCISIDSCLLTEYFIVAWRERFIAIKISDWLNRLFIILTSPAAV